MTVKEQPKRLGRGLAALLGEAASPAGPAAAAQNLPVDLLEPSPFQPRREMDDTALGELADSIAQRGVLQPLLVRPHPSQPEHYQIIAGERRWRAAQRAGLHEVPVLVRELTDADAMAAGLVENLQREDLNPVEEAEGYRRLIEEFKLSQEQLGEAVGKSRAHIGNVLRLLRLPVPVLGMVREGKLSAGHARALLTAEEPLRCAKEIIKRDFSVRQAEVWINDQGKTFKSNFKWRHPEEGMGGELRAIEQDLASRLGLKARVLYNGKAGTLTLHYEGLDQLDALLKLLNG